MALNEISDKIRGYPFKHITHLKDLMDFLEKHTRPTDVFFRGQSNELDLLPKIARPKGVKSSLDSLRREC